MGGHSEVRLRCLPFPLSNRGSGSGDFLTSASKARRGGVGGLSSDIAEVPPLPKPCER